MATDPTPTSPSTTGLPAHLEQQAPSIAAAIEAGRRQSQLHQIEHHKPVVAIPKDHQLAEVPRDDKRKLAQPRFLTAAPQFQEVGGFIAYVESFKDSGTRIWYDLQGKFLAVFDYHQSSRVLAAGQEAAGPAPLDDPQPKARHGDHTAQLSLIRSPEWTAWAGMSEKAMNQQQFAEFIEDNAPDVLQPGLQQMLAVAQGLHASIGGTFRSALNQADGSVSLHFDQQVEGTVKGSDAKVPTEFIIGIRPFIGSSRYQLTCRFRYRVGGGELRLHFKVMRMEAVTELSLDAVVKRIADQTGIAPALGSLPAQSIVAGV